MQDMVPDTCIRMNQIEKILFFFSPHRIDYVVAVGGRCWHTEACWCGDGPQAIPLVKDIILKGCDNAGKRHACYIERYKG